MRKREYTHVQILLPGMEAMMGEGKTQRGAAGHPNFRPSVVGKGLIKRQRERSFGICGHRSYIHTKQSVLELSVDPWPL